jgi:serine protease Do
MRGFESLVEKLRRSTVQILNRGGGGSGIVWNSAGHIVTNAHVVRGGEADVIDAGGHRFRARVIRRDQARDLVLLETDRSLEAADIGDSDSVRAGQFVIATGNPLGIPGAVTAGTIHATGQNGFGFSGRWIKADIRLAPGNSGGMLADAEGRVIGVNTLIFEDLGLAIPSNDVAAFAAQSEARAA